MVTIEIDDQDKIIAEAGSMVYMSPNIHMKAKARGGVMKSLGRTLMGETIFLTEYTSTGGTGTISFGGNAPGTIIPLNIDGTHEYITQKHAFLCAEATVELSVAFQKRLGSIFFGGEGLILERLSGTGLTFVHACGDFIEKTLRAGENILVDTGSVVAWEASVGYHIRRVKGVKTIFFGGEGLFLTELTGPGNIILQSMTLHNLAMALAPFLPKKNSGG